MPAGSGVPINIALFGPLTVRKNGSPLPLSITGHTLGLLKFLLTNASRPFRRDYLSELFWPDTGAKRKRSALNTALWRIRSQITGRLDLRLLTEADSTLLEIGPDVEVDSIELFEALESLRNNCEAEPHSDVELRLEHALDTSDQPFLDGLSSEWALTARQKYSEIRMRALALMMRRCGESHRYDQAINYGHRLLNVDPYREDTHCEMMWLYVLSGRRAHAIQQYRQCAELLQNELGVEPMAEMQLLHRHIKQGSNDLSIYLTSSDCRERNSVGPLFEAIARSRTDVYSALCEQLR